MLKILTTAVIGLLAISVSAQNKFSIEGKISEKYEGQKVMLNYNVDGKMIKDSTIVRNGFFLLKGKVSDATKAKIALKNQVEDKGPMTLEKMATLDEQEFFLENTNFSVKGENIKIAQIKGGVAQADYLLLKSQLKPLQDKMEPLSKKMAQYIKEKNDKARDELFPQLRAIRMDMNKVEDDFMRNHLDSYVSLDLINGRSSVIDPLKIEPYFNPLSPRIKNSALGRKLNSRLEIIKKTDIGKLAIDFVMNNTAGKPIALSSLRGKYVLLDFWASWCGPCRAENPNVLKVYNKFKDKNFEIIAVSLDDKKEPWLKAIENDGLPWIQVSDLTGWKNKVAAQYDVKAIPQNFLIGPDGIILAKNLSGEELGKKIAELIKN